MKRLILAASMLLVPLAAAAEETTCPSGWTPEDCAEADTMFAAAKKRREDEAAAVVAAAQKRQADDERMYQERDAARAQVEADSTAVASRRDIQLRAWSILACVSAADRKEASAAIATEKAYAKKAGVVNLEVLEEQKEILKASDQNEARARLAIKRSKGKPLGCAMPEVEIYRACRDTSLPVGAAFDEDEESCLHRSNQQIVMVIDKVTAQ